MVESQNNDVEEQSTTNERRHFFMEITTENYLIVDILKALANESRLKILQYGINGISQARLPSLLNISQSLVSRYIGELNDLGLIEYKKIGGNKVVKTTDEVYTVKILPISSFTNNEFESDIL